MAVENIGLWRYLELHPAWTIDDSVTGSHTLHLPYCSHLELIHAIPRPCLCDKLPEDDAEAEDVALGGHAAQLGVEAFGSPARKGVRTAGRCMSEGE